MRAETEGSSTSSPARPTSSNSAPPGTPPPNAFSAAFLDAARRREDARDSEEVRGGPALAAGALDTGPFDIEEVPAGRGQLWAVVRRGQSLGPRGDEPHSVVAVFLERTAALLAAAVLPAEASPNHLEVGVKARRLGLPVHDGRRHLGHLARPHEHFARDLHAARTLAARSDSLVLLAEALDYETLVLFGRALMRRLEGAG